MGWKRALYGLVHRRDLRDMEAGFEDPSSAQERFLLSLVRRNADSDFGRKHGFSACSSAEEFRRRVPRSTYQDFKPHIERIAGGEKGVLTAEQPLFFALTSGTSGPEKLIPMTPSLERDMARGQVYWNSRLIKEDEAFGRWKYLVLVSPSRERFAPSGLPCRAVSSRILVGGAGHIFRLKPFYRAAVAVPSPVFEVRDGQARNHLLAVLALSNRLGSITAANPSTIVHFCMFLHEHRRELAEDLKRGEVRPAVVKTLSEEERTLLKSVLSGLRPRPRRAGEVEDILAVEPFSLRRLWPGIEVVNCWLGGTLSLYLRRLRLFSGDIPLRDVGYRASEGFFGLPLGNETPAGALHVTGNFFEFDEDPSSGRNPLLLRDLEPGGRYRLIVSQAGGLYRYDMEDIVEVTGFYKKTPLVRFLHKAGDALSLTGEKLTGLQAVNAVTRFERKLGLERLDFVLTHSLDIPPAYIFLLEAGERTALRLRLESSSAASLDEGLSLENSEYRSKRASGRLAAARISFLPPGTLEALRSRRSRLSSSDTQFKPGHLLGEGRDRDWLLALASRSDAEKG